MTSDFSIRRAGEADIATLVELRERMLRELDEPEDERLASLAAASIEWFGEALPAERATGWIAEDAEGRVLGGVSFTVLETQPQYRTPQGRVGQIYGLFVEPDVRGVGIATELVRHCIEYAHAREIDVLTLHAADKARPIYERLGFSESNEMRMFPRA